MEDLYSFVEASDDLQNKVKVFEDTIQKIMKQTVECAIFIREYTGHGFAGELPCYRSMGHSFTDEIDREACATDT